jgi:hypothetical protein
MVMMNVKESDINRVLATLICVKEPNSGEALKL